LLLSRRKSARKIDFFSSLLVEHCRRNPAAQILAWTDEIARTAGCTLNGQPIPTASQLMLAAPFAE
jgi:hypothetical protein